MFFVRVLFANCVTSSRSEYTRNAIMIISRLIWWSFLGTNRWYCLFVGSWRTKASVKRRYNPFGLFNEFIIEFSCKPFRWRAFFSVNPHSNGVNFRIHSIQLNVTKWNCFVGCVIARCNVSVVFILFIGFGAQCVAVGRQSLARESTSKTGMGEYQLQCLHKRFLFGRRLHSQF